MRYIQKLAPFCVASLALGMLALSHFNKRILSDADLQKFEHYDSKHLNNSFLNSCADIGLKNAATNLLKSAEEIENSQDKASAVRSFNFAIERFCIQLSRMKVYTTDVEGLLKNDIGALSYQAAVNAEESIKKLDQTQVATEKSLKWIELTKRIATTKELPDVEQVPAL